QLRLVPPARIYRPARAVARYPAHLSLMEWTPAVAVPALVPKDHREIASAEPTIDIDGAEATEIAPGPRERVGFHFGWHDDGLAAIRMIVSMRRHIAALNAQLSLCCRRRHHQRDDQNS